jgi:predicted Zn-dependent peptidase
MKPKIASIIALFAMCLSISAQIDKSDIPRSNPEIKLEKTNKFNLKNGLTVLMQNDQKLPTISATLTINNTPHLQGDLSGVSSIMGNLVGRETSTFSENTLKEQVENLQGTISFSRNSASASASMDSFDNVLELMADGVIHSMFKKEEFDKEVKITLAKIESDEKSAKYIARRVENILTYGKDHPYGEFMTTKSIQQITLDDVKNEYNTYFKPNNAYLVIIGDFNQRKMKKTVKRFFGDWKAGDVPNYKMPEVKNMPTTEIDFTDVPNITQSEIAVINTLDLDPKKDDYLAALLANHILGGSKSSKLMNTLKEDKRYTEESYSKLNQDRYVSRFGVFASVQNIVTDSAMVEIMKQINTIRYKGISEKDLEVAKKQHITNFVDKIQTPAALAKLLLNQEFYHLPKDYYQTYIANINAVTIDDVQDAAIKYFRGDKARIIITGNGIEILKNLEKNDNYLINYFDPYGEPTEKPSMTIPVPEGLTTQMVIDNYIKAIGGAEKVAGVKTMKFTYKASIQGQQLELTRKIAAPNKESNVITFGGQVFQQQVFDGEKGYAVQQGRKTDLAGKELETAQKKMLPFEDMAYASGKLDRIEPLDGKTAYVIIVGDTEIFYDVASGLKVKSIRKPNGAQSEIKIPTDFSDYKEVNGILIPHKLDQGMGRFTLNFVLQEVKINEGVEDKDFE